MRPLALVLTVALLFASSAALLAPAPAGAQEGAIRIGLDVDAGTADPRLSRDTSARRVVDIVFDGLVYLDPELTPQPALAESWQTAEDGLTWTFTLRQGVAFHDGEALTAEDVVYTFETILDEALAAPYRALYTPIQRVTAVDPSTVEFTLSQPYAPFLSYMDMGIVPKHIAEDPNSDFANHPVGTGPFEFVSWEKNNKIEFTANPDYWGGVPALETVTYLIVPDNTVRATALETGDLDLIHSPLSPQDVARLQTNDELTVHTQTALGFTHLIFNTTDPVLADVNVRRAIAHLVDKATIAEAIYQGMDTPGESPLVPNTWWYTEVTDQPFDPAAAQTIFAEAGWTDSDGDGVLDKDGQKLSLLLKTHSEDPNRIQTIEYLQAVFSEHGIEATVETAEWPTFRDSVLNQDFQIALLGWLGLVDPDRAMYNQFLCAGASNDGKYCNPRVDELLQQGRATADQAARKDLYAEAAQIIVDEVAYVVVLYQGYIVATAKDVTGFEPHPSGSFRSLATTSVGG